VLLLQVHAQAYNFQGKIAYPNPEDWSQYPQSLFPNWTKFQQDKSGIARLVYKRTNPAKSKGDSSSTCSIYKLDVTSDGIFRADEGAEWVVKDTPRDRAGSTEKFWEGLKEKVC
jgi:hypothetical protein